MNSWFKLSMSMFFFDSSHWARKFVLLSVDDTIRFCKVTFVSEYIATYHLSPSFILIEHGESSRCATACTIKRSAREGTRPEIEPWKIALSTFI